MALCRTLLIFFVSSLLVFPAFADETTTTTTEETTQAAAPPVQTTTTTTETTTTKMDINKASVQDLSRLKGLNLPRAKAISSYRQRNGEFKSLDELKNVKGFKNLSEDQMNDIKSQLTIQ